MPRNKSEARVSGQRRWQPPHPDPGQPKRDNAHIPLCEWRGCPKLVAYDVEVLLCEAHLELAFRAYAKRLNADLDARQREDEARAAAATQVERLVDAEEPLPDGTKPPGWVYYILIDDTIKIGYASNVPRRMRTYPPSAKLLAVEPGTKKLEMRRHEHFSAYLAWGREWFRDVPELREWIASLVTLHGNPTRHAYSYSAPQSGRQVSHKRWRGNKKTAA